MLPHPVITWWAPSCQIRRVGAADHADVPVGLDAKGTAPRTRRTSVSLHCLAAYSRQHVAPQQGAQNDSRVAVPSSPCLDSGPGTWDRLAAWRSSQEIEAMSPTPAFFQASPQFKSFREMLLTARRWTAQAALSGPVTINIGLSESSFLGLRLRMPGRSSCSRSAPTGLSPQQPHSHSGPVLRASLQA